VSVDPGSIQGGWEFVWAAYLVSAVVLGGYAVSVMVRLRAERARAEREAQRTQEVS
jgi:hypothetical protein